MLRIGETGSCCCVYSGRYGCLIQGPNAIVRGFPRRSNSDKLPIVSADTDGPRLIITESAGRLISCMDSGPSLKEHKGDLIVPQHGASYDASIFDTIPGTSVFKLANYPANVLGHTHTQGTRL